MFKDKAEMLIDALKSGEYQKGTERLCTIYVNDDGSEERKYCCLGVLCELAIVNQVEIWKKEYIIEDHLKPDDENRAMKKIAYDYSTTNLREIATLWAGTSYIEETKLVKLNDNNETWQPVIEYLEGLLNDN